MRICCLNNYPLDRMVDLAGQGLTPGQHGWGLQHLRATSHEVLVAPFPAAGDHPILERLSTGSRHVLGQLDQEFWAVRKRADILYAADQLSLAGVALSRWVSARHARVVSVAHHPLVGRNARLRLAALRAHDAVVALSEILCRDLARSDVRAHFLPWGPDLGSELYKGSCDDGFAISTGKSNRDLPILVRALAKTGYEGRVFDVRGTVAAAPDNVTLVRLGGAGIDPYGNDIYLAKAVLDMTRSAGFVVIPIANPDRLTGLTEINDALALGKPIVITRSPYTPIDVEKIGCGIVVEPGDTDGWVAAIETLEDPSTRREMGARARQFAEQSWNYDIFGTELVTLLDDLA
jgi:glycosyltransferase involved in cell wall biosynthesis